jgi:hypothetical protein
MRKIMKIFGIIISCLVAFAIIYCAYIGDTRRVSVLASILAVYAVRGYLNWGD